ncbi:hypothetical protein HWV62_16116 [Athelia sp. TMB]|nr:hypothetical protein HWV62_16116 [Athelia sp. TMB]
MPPSTAPGPCIAIISAGAMGAAVAAVLTARGCTVLTDLAGRSADTRRRAAEAGMQDAPLREIAARARWVLSILPPGSAERFADEFLAAAEGAGAVFVDCNAVNPATAQRIAARFSGVGVPFLDGCITGWPPRGEYRPTFYASAAPRDANLLKEFDALNEWGLPVKLLEGEGVSVGAASALKMSYAVGYPEGHDGPMDDYDPRCGVSYLKGLRAHLPRTAAHDASPATAEALMQELHASQPAVLKKIIWAIPDMLPKAYRWVHEMEEIAEFVGEDEREIYDGMSKVFARVEYSRRGDRRDVAVLEKFVEDAKRL